MLHSHAKKTRPCSCPWPVECNSHVSIITPWRVYMVFKVEWCVVQRQWNNGEVDGVEFVFECICPSCSEVRGLFIGTLLLRISRPGPAVRTSFPTHVLHQRYNLSD